MKIQKVIYRTEAEVVGGRNGHAISSDKRLVLKLSMPREMGGAEEEGTNPEQLFAAGYSACFLSAMQFVANTKKIILARDTSVRGIVGLGSVPGGFGLEVELRISIPGITLAAAKDLVEATHRICPYSNATRNNIEVKLTIV